MKDKDLKPLTKPSKQYRRINPDFSLKGKVNPSSIPPKWVTDGLLEYLESSK